MRPQKAETMGEGDLFRGRLDQIVNQKPELVQLGAKIYVDWINGERATYGERAGRGSRAARHLLLLKQIYGLTDNASVSANDPHFTALRRP